ncbi:uncharacterized protein IWZ02DRAFT_430555 [Phyllosticta citriasiana]|uniref:Uncharacterized protein n=1 Tax=Phyllosticta citriasiana TaxID=595635 RepID=A0ABR1KJ96_9PEZI
MHGVFEELLSDFPRAFVGSHRTSRRHKAFVQRTLQAFDAIDFMFTNFWDDMAMKIHMITRESLDHIYLNGFKLNVQDRAIMSGYHLALLFRDDGKTTARPCESAKHSPWQDIDYPAEQDLGQDSGLTTRGEASERFSFPYWASRTTQWTGNFEIPKAGLRLTLRLTPFRRCKFADDVEFDDDEVDFDTWGEEEMLLQFFDPTTASGEKRRNKNTE